MMKNIYISILLICILACMCHKAIAQQVAPTIYYEVKPQTPNITQFLRYDELPVSEYTGVPNISIPIYNIQEDGVNMPINLSYHAGGIKVNQDASWVGLGWDLSFGSIVQTINDEDDLFCEFPTQYKRLLPDYWRSGGYTAGYGYFPFSCDVNGGELCTTKLTGYRIDEPTDEFSFRVSTAGYTPINGTLINFATDEGLFSSSYPTDSEPDIFKVNLLGVSLNVIIDFKKQGNNFIVLNKKGYKIEINNETWTITTPEGVKAYFTDHSETKTLTNSSNSGGWYAVKNMRIWMLNKIETKNGKSINISYNRSKDKIKIRNISHVYGHKTLRNDGCPEGLLSVRAYIGNELNIIPDGVIETIADSEEYQFYPSVVEFPNGKILFSISDRSDLNNTSKLDKIEIFNYNNEKIKNTEFKYNYFNEKTGNGKRLKLLTVKENDNPHYSFSYNLTPLPFKNSFEQDYWGYYNGSTSNRSLVPNILRFGDLGLSYDITSITDPRIINNNMSANLDFTKAGILEKITYPTGGNISFEYELNCFDNYRVPDYDKMTMTQFGVSKGLGLRVKSVVYHDANETEIKKTSYQYSDGKAILTIPSMMKVFTREIYVGRHNSSCMSRVYDYLSINPTGFQQHNPLSPLSGVGYSVVLKKETSIDNNGNNGYTETWYNNKPSIISLANAYFSSESTLLSLPSFKNWNYPENGTPARIKYFDSNNVLNKEIEYKYQNIKSSIFYGTKIVPYMYLIYEADKNWESGSYTAYAHHIFGYYPILDFESLLTEKIESDYFNEDVVSTTVSYSYDQNNLLSRVACKDNGISFKYESYTYPTANSTNSIVKDLYNNNRLSEVVRKISLNEHGYKDEYVAEFKKSGQGIYPHKVVIDGHPYGSNPKVHDVTYDHFNEFGMPRYSRDNQKEQPVLYVYDKIYPVWIIENVEWDQYENILSIVNSDNKEKNNTLRERYPQAMVSTYTYKPLVGMLTFTDPRGVITYYEYDDFGRLKEAYYYEDGDMNKKRIVQSYDYHYRNQ